MKNLLCMYVLLALLCPEVSGKNKDHLALCWAKQVKPLGNGYLHFSYTETSHTLAHLFEPWQSYHSAGNGTIWCNGTKFSKTDTMSQWSSTYYSKTQLDSAHLLYVDYGDKELSHVTTDMFAEEPFNEARYSPALLINYFYTHPALVTKDKDRRYAIYTTTINKTIIKLFIQKKENVIEKVVTLHNHDQYGDVTETISYKDYAMINTLPYPATIFISKVNEKVSDTINLKSTNYISKTEPLLTIPTDYKMNEATAKQPEITVEKYNDHIHFITLKHTNGRAMVVEFNDYMLVAESPRSSENGELIINEVKKIAPGKPIKYFIFSHYHPDYTGGIRPFIHKGATVLCTKGDMDFIQYLADAPHSLQPDSLWLQPRKLQMEDVGARKTITDGNYEMGIYYIGTKSEHTKDYLVYYFPKEKMLWEGDLVGISEKGPVRKAGKRQAGLYNAIKELQLDVATIQQSWPVGYGQKTEIPFSDMEAAMNVK